MVDKTRFAEKLEEIFKELIIEEKRSGVDVLKNNIEKRYKDAELTISLMQSYRSAKITGELIDELDILKIKFKTIYDDFDDKLMIFIIGNGKVGKSSLLNSLVGEELAKVSFEPCTWKIDVYSPELDNYALLKTQNGEVEKLSVKEAKARVDIEETLAKDGKKRFNEAKNKALREIKGKEAREEMREKLSKELLYKSDISEVRWPIKNKVIVENCLFVDTPGLVQNLYDSSQMGSIQNYYHKSDGIIWMVDATTIAGANVKSTLDDLECEFETIGGMRGNIIGVVNRIDIVEENDGETGVNAVLNKAEEIFEGKFNKILPLSAKKAMEGKIEESGLNTLRDAIRSIFVEKAELVRSSSKTQGIKIVQKEFISTINRYLSRLNYKNKERQDKLNNVYKQGEELKNNIQKEINRMIESYLATVNMNINLKIDELAKGENEEFIKDSMYEIHKLEELINIFIKSKSNEIESTGKLLLKKAHVSEYKYIESDTKISLVNNMDVNLVNAINLDDVYIFTPDEDNGFISAIWNFAGRMNFFFKKKKIKEDLNSVIKNKCNNIKNEICMELNLGIDKYVCRCGEQIDESFEALFCNKEKIEYIIRILQQRSNDIETDIRDKKLYELLI